MPLDLADDFQRLILRNQYRILELLHRLSEEDGEADTYANYQTMLDRGYEHHYGELTEAFHDPMPAEECKEVRDTLDMFTQLGYTYRDLEDKTGIDPGDVEFEGYDNTEEAGHLLYTQFLIKDSRRWSNLDPGGKKDFDSHEPNRDDYRAMVAAWKASADIFELTKDDILRIVAAK